MKRRCNEAGCPELTRHAACPFHEAQRRAKYTGDWPAISRVEIARWVADNGWVCPVGPHPSHDLTTDHGPPLRVMCRGHNTAKSNTERGS